MLRPKAKQNKNHSLKLCGHLALVLAGLVLAFVLLLPPQAAKAQESIKFSVTPPLFQINMGKGEQWASTIKVVNNNKEDLPVYTTVMNFEAQGEKGYGKFVPIISTAPEEAPQMLAYWVEVSNDPVIVPPESSVTIPFAIRVPKDAPPGGHYAAIMVGNAPFGAKNDDDIVLSISSLVTSLLFVRIQGDIQEEGEIVDFYSDKSFYQEPNVNFNLRFENNGNVHLQPQGEIKITNMWGKDRGTIPINQKTNFGNVLRNSIRKFEYQWEGDGGILEAGKYTALATLTFGFENRRTVSQETTFWVVPLKPVLGTLGGIIAGIFLLIFGIRAFVKNLVARQARMMGIPNVALEGVSGNTDSYIKSPRGLPKRAYSIKRRTSRTSKNNMSKQKNSSKKVKRSKPAYMEEAGDSSVDDKRLKGMAWLKKEYQKQGKEVEQEIESTGKKKKFSIKGILLFWKKDKSAAAAKGKSGKKPVKAKGKSATKDKVTTGEGLFHRLGAMVVASRRYIITVLVTVVIMGGVFGALNYFSAKDKEPAAPGTEASMQVDNSGSRQANQSDKEDDDENSQTPTMDEPLVINNDNSSVNEADSQVTADGEPVVEIKEPEEILPEIDPADVSVAVYNGSGIPGLAGQYAKLVEDLGFNVADVGNADSFDYTISEISYKPEVAAIREDVNSILIGASQSQEQAGQDFDIILTIGSSEGVQ